MAGSTNPSGVYRADISGSDIAAGPVVVNPTTGYLRNVLVIDNNNNVAVNITDGPGGPIIGIVPGKATSGTVLSFDMPAYVSINIPQTAAAPDLAITYD